LSSMGVMSAGTVQPAGNFRILRIIVSTSGMLATVSMSETGRDVLFPAHRKMTDLNQRCTINACYWSLWLSWQ
jgi:hypothetical protein